MSQKFGLGLIGCGRIANAHLRSAQRISNVSIVAVSSRTEAKAKQTAQEFGAQRFYLDYHELLADPEVHGVIICLPHDLHLPAVEACAQASKHILLDKPMARSLAEAEKMVQVSDEARVTFMVGQSRRFLRSVLEARKRIQDIGQPFRIMETFLVNFPDPATDWWRSAKRAGGLAFLLNGSHSVDFILWMMQKLPTKVYATAHRRNSSWEGEDEGDILMTFDQGEIASIQISLNTLPEIHEARVIGPQGTMYFTEEKLPGPYRFTTKLQINEQVVVPSGPDDDNYTLQLQEFINSINEKREPMCSGREILGVVKVLDAAHKSAAHGLVVEL